jgi:hypothetical protein
MQGKMPSLGVTFHYFGFCGGLFMSIPPTRQKRFSACCGLALAMSALLILGCGGKSGTRETAADDQPGETAADSDSGTDAKPPKGGKGKKKASIGDHIGEIKIDAWPEVWLKQPLSVAAESGTAVGPAADMAADTKPPAGDLPTEAVKTAPGKAAEPKGGATEWGTVISGEALADETKSIKNSLTPNLADVGRYNSKYKDVQVDATVLAVMAGVAPNVPDAPSWKKNSKFIRDVSSQVAAESKANGPNFYKKTRDEYDKLEALLSGNNPPGLGESPESVKFSEVAQRLYLMKRMNRASNWMKTEINTEALFKKNSGRVAHEGEILSLLGKVIATPDYADADADEYKNYAESVSQSGRDVNEAVKKEDFKAYTEALDRCLKACNKCHEVFKNG